MKHKKNIVWVVVFILSLLFVLLSKYEDRPALRNLDLAVTVKVQEKIDQSTHLRAASIVSNIMESGAFFGGPEFTSVMVFSMALWLFSTRTRPGARWKSVIILVLFLLILAVEFLGKTIVSHPPPPYFLLKNPTTIFPKYHVAEAYSFPSGHAARATFLAIVSLCMIARMSKAWQKVHLRTSVICGVIFYVVLVGVSKVYLGHHWFSDIVGGMLLGGALGVVSYAVVW